MTRVLIVEDESIVALHLKRLIEQLDHEVIGIAPSMESALVLAEGVSPDLALVDIRIEGKDDGVATARALRAATGCAIVFVTAFADADTLERTDAVGAAGYLVKPFSEAQLRAVVSTAIASHRRMQTVQSRKRHLAGALMAIAHAVVIVDEDRHVTFMNPPAEELTGHLSSMSRGRPIGEILRCSRDGQPIDPLNTAESPVEGHIRVTSADGSTREVSLSLSRLTGGGEGNGFAVSLQDISDRAITQWDETQSDMRQRLGSSADFAGMIGSSLAMVNLFGQIEQLAAVDWTVLIEGETGVGKELVARALHQIGGRRDGPIVAVNCAGLTDSLLGSQLFGHNRGAFTGAVSDHPGVFESADGGTLFLDEIGDVSPALQRTLLRVLDDRKVVRIGDRRERPIDVRIVCASQHHLPKLVEAGLFRADLMYRLRAARIHIAPLRDRGGDILMLAEHFLREAAQSTGRELSGFERPAIDVLRTYTWPGNVRELRGAVSHAALSAGGELVRKEDLPPEILEAPGATLPALPEDERERILVALQRAGGNRSKAARILGVGRATLYRRLTDLDIDVTGD